MAYPKQSLGALFFGVAFFAITLIGITISSSAWAQCSPPRTGPSSGSGGPFLVPGYAGTTWTINANGGNPYFDAGSNATLTTSDGAAFSWGFGGCAPFMSTVVGFYTQTSDYPTWSSSWTNGYGAGISITLGSIVASPINLGSNNPNCSANSCEGDPVNAATGNLYEVETDFVGGPNTHIELRRYYNSLAVNATAFGQNWRSTYDRNILTFSGSNLAQAYRADGKIENFRLQSGAWVGDPDVTDTLAAVKSKGTQTGWQLVTSDDTTENYNLAGQLTSIVTRAGLKTMLTYNTSNQLTTVTGPFGHTLTYTYNANGTVATVKIPDGGVFSYAYDASNNLISVTYPDSTVRQYTYTNSSFPNALTGIIDELGNPYTTITYDSSGRVISTQHAGGADLTSIAYTSNVFGISSATVTDPNGNTHTYSFTSQYGLVKPSALSGAEVPSVGGNAFTYDAIGFIASKTDYNGNVTTYTHDSRGDETSRTEASGTPLARTITTTWLSNFHLPATITEPNRTTTFTYDSHGNLLTKTISDSTESREWIYTYNKGLVLTITDPNSHVTTYTYDSTGDLATSKDALGHVTHFKSYDADGKLLSMTDPNGLVTASAYDARSRLTSRSLNSEKTSYAYDAAGNLLKITHPDASFTSFAYDAAHRLTSILDTLGNSIAYMLDPADNVTAIKVYGPSSSLTWSRSFTYDSVERLAMAIGAVGQTTTYGYDNNGNFTNVTDPLSHATSYAYDALNRLGQITDPNGGATQIGYNANDDITGVTDPRSLITSYTWTGLDNQTALLSPDTGQSSKTFDAVGNVLTSTDARGDLTSYAYDALNRLSKATYADGTTASWTYDTGANGIGHLTAIADITGTTTWTYNAFGKVTQKQQTIGSVVLTTSYTYDNFQRMSKIKYPSGKAVSYSYDADGRVNAITSSNKSLISNITYMPFGPVAGWTEANGFNYSRSYDQDGRITAISIGGASNVNLGYTLDSANRITALTETGLPTKTFAYDGLDRLTSLTNGSATTGYAYDADGNRTSVSVAAGTTAYNYPSSSNRLLSLTGFSNAAYSYDAAGNMTSDGVNSWSYDARGRMAQVANSLSASYGVNALGQRVTKSGTGVTTNTNEFVYDESGHMLGEYDAAGNVLEETVWLPRPIKGQVGLPVAVLTATTSYVNPDYLGAPHVITNSKGKQAWIWDHLAFGDNPPNQNPAGLGTFNYNFRFPGQYADNESGLNYNYYRDYNPGLGRYIESDPIGLMGGLNTYGYVKNDPTSFSDLFGLRNINAVALPPDMYFYQTFYSSLAQALFAGAAASQFLLQEELFAPLYAGALLAKAQADTYNPNPLTLSASAVGGMCIDKTFEEFGSSGTATSVIFDQALDQLIPIYEQAYEESQQNMNYTPVPLQSVPLTPNP